MFSLLAAVSLQGGDLASRFELTLQRILQGGPPRFDDEFILADVVPQSTRRFTNFSGDVSGRYIGALASAASLTPSRQGTLSMDALDRIVTRVLRLQKPDGHFGDPVSVGNVLNSDMAILWGNGRLLIGLLEYYRVRQRPDVLAAAQRLGDFLVAIGPLLNSDGVRREYHGEKFAVGYICWTQNLEGLVELYRVSRPLGDAERYLRLAREIADRTDRHPSQHSHGFLTTLRGIVELYRVTGERRYLDQAEAGWKGVFQSGNVLAQGGVPEMFAPQIKRDEGCSEADWLRLALALWRETRNPEYLRQAEYTLFNEFSFNQFHTGDFGHHTLTSAGMSAPTARAWWCCTFHGLRALVAVFQSVFHETDGERSDYDLPVDGQIAAGGLTLRANSSLGQNATVRMEIVKSDAQIRTIALRIPDWAKRMTLSEHGQKLAGTSRDGYLEVRRAWKSGEVFSVSYVFRTRLLSPPSTPDQPASRVAVLHGPWLLAVDEASSRYYFDERSIQNLVQRPA